MTVAYYGSASPAVTLRPSCVRHLPSDTSHARSKRPSSLHQRRPSAPRLRP